MAFTRKTHMPAIQKKEQMEETESEPSAQHSDQAPALFGEHEVSAPTAGTVPGQTRSSLAQPGKPTKRIKLRRKPSYGPTVSQGEEIIQNGDSGQDQGQPASFIPQPRETDEGDLQQNPVIDVATAAALERETRNGFVRKQESFDRLINERPHEN